MSKPSRPVAVRMPSVEEDKLITAAANADPDAQPLTPKQLKEMVPARALRGRPPSPNRKRLVSIRYSPEVLDYFRSTGEGWQARIDGVLKQYVKRKVRREQGGV
ncbi:MAG: BrnA antitoxin family protein [Burkholderiales bacterium]|nr:BrnA antitoxin family protein [Burkholderiales bacterium]